VLALISDYLSIKTIIRRLYLYIVKAFNKAANAIKILYFYILKLKRSHCARNDYIVCKACFKTTAHFVNNMIYKYQTKFEL
jgi:hypothetical protein